MHSGPTSFLRVQHVRYKCLWRFPIDHLLSRGEVASLRHQVSFLLEVPQPPNPKILEHYLCLFAPSTQPFADALATLASMVKLAEGDKMRKLRIKVHGMSTYCMDIKECMNVEAEINGKQWYHDIKAYIRNGGYPSRPMDSEQKFIKCMACQFFLSGEVLYKRNHDTTLLRCIDTPEANHLKEEMHKGFLRAHTSGTLLAQNIMRGGYYWLTMERDYIKHVRMFHHCQVYQNRKNVPPRSLHSLAVP